MLIEHKKSVQKDFPLIYSISLEDVSPHLFRPSVEHQVRSLETLASKREENSDRVSVSRDGSQYQVTLWNTRSLTAGPIADELNFTCIIRAGYPVFQNVPKVWGKCRQTALVMNSWRKTFAYVLTHIYITPVSAIKQEESRRRLLELENSVQNRPPRLKGQREEVVHRKLKRAWLLV